METLNLQPFGDAGLAASFDDGLRSRAHEMVENGDFDAFRKTEKPMMFEPGMNRQAMDDSGVFCSPQVPAPALSTTGPISLEQDLGSLLETVNPTDLWTGTSVRAGDVGTQPALTSDAAQAHMPTESLPSPAPQTNSKKSTPARHSVNRTHSKAKAARKDSHQDHDGAKAGSASPPTPESKMQRLRERNKVAAANCRSRQRKQVQAIELKCNRLGTANKELKRQVRELTGELNRLRAFALQHHSCSCPVTCYNFNQARRLAANLQAFGRTGAETQQKQQQMQKTGGRES